MPALAPRRAFFVWLALLSTAPSCAGGDARTPAESSGGATASGGQTSSAASSGGGTTATVGSSANAAGGVTGANGGTTTVSVGGRTTTAGGGAGAGSGGAPNPANGGAPSASSGGASAGAAGSSGNGGAPGATSPRLFYLDVGGRVLSVKPDGTDVRVLVRGATGLPDGVAVDTAAGHVFWTNMGVPASNDGFVSRVNLDGSGATTPVAAGKTFTPKQLKLDATNGKLYWSDREGMRILRANLDGSGLETLVETGSGDTARADAANWCVGIALDVPGKKIYWTQKGGDNAGVGTLRRAGIEIPAGEDPAHRTDIETLFDHLPEPIDLDVDLSKRQIYWTDRGNPPNGNTVSRAPMDPPAGGASGRTDQEILVRNLAEGIGISLDVAHGLMYFTDIGGTVYVANLDGSGEKKLLTGQGSLTGIAYVELPM